jgi:hypothetical protein
VTAPNPAIGLGVVSDGLASRAVTRGVAVVTDREAVTPLADVAKGRVRVHRGPLVGREANFRGAVVVLRYRGVFVDDLCHALMVPRLGAKSQALGLTL